LVDFGLRFNHKGRHYFKAANGEDIALSLSIGAAMFNGHPDYERLIQIADEALYIAKRRGRNRVELCKTSL
jgi:diguanylate cyclase (GGDEF)-like protein